MDLTKTIDGAREALKKEAELAQTGEERLNAFEFGVDTYLQQAGLDREEFAKQAGVAPEAVGATIFLWATGQLQEATE